VYEILLERSAERGLRKLSATDFQRLISRIKALADNPRPSSCRKITGSKNDWRIRVGTYRVIYEIDEKAKLVKVMRIRHRKEAYR
jgi:mRNA interferase RelE/StbE